VSARDHLNTDQTYQYHHMDYPDVDADAYYVYKGREEVGDMLINRDPGKATLVSMNVAKGHRAIAGTMLGIAGRSAEARGAKLLPPEDLSAHSSKLVQGAQGRGLVTGSHANEQTNRLNFRRARHVMPSARIGDRLNTNVVNEAREHIRNTIRQRPKRR
jgi:hypothetical protein